MVCNIYKTKFHGESMPCILRKEHMMYDATLLIFYGELWNTAEKDLYETHKHSPYRNYIRDIFRRHDASERVLYLTVLDEITKIANIEKQLVHELGALARITVTDSEYDGYQYLKVFSSAASKKHMLVKLKSHTGCDNVVTIGSIEGKYDVYIGDGGGNATIKKLKKLYRNDIYH